MLGLLAGLWIGIALLILEKVIRDGEPPWMVLVALLWPLAVLWAALVLYVIRPFVERRERRGSESIDV